LPPATRSVGIGFLERHRGKQLTWDPAFNRMDAPEIVLTSIAAAVAVAGAVAPPLKTHWRGGFLADNAVRNALRLPSYQARLDARDVSDVGLAMITTIPILVDSVIVAYWYRGSDDVALQMGLIDAEAIAVSAAIQGAGNFFGGRERPYGVDCGTQLSNHTIDCQSTSRYRSFFSGHSTLSFTSASLICAHHLSLDLFENAADPAMCASAFVAAAAISTLRIAGDMHYLSDVLAGAVVGTAVGLGIPLLHHYRRAGPATASQLQMHVLPSWGGAQLVGSF
jgi:membrane-associated phospholipid phosphatase